MYPDVNEDCEKCAYSYCHNDGGGDYENIVWTCTKKHTQLTSTKVENKPCELPEGKFYVCRYVLND
jgi:hypothetical protein